MNRQVGGNRGRAAEWGAEEGSPHLPAPQLSVPPDLCHHRDATDFQVSHFSPLQTVPVWGLFLSFYRQIMPLIRQILVKYYACTLHVQFC